MYSSEKKSYPTRHDLRDIVEVKWRCPINAFDEVYPGIYIGDARTAKCTMTLENEKITHVLNAALGSDECMYVDTSEDFYNKKKFKCEFLGIPAMDIMAYQLHHFFKGTSDFIDSALKSNGKVLVHCREGISRSATLVLAYLMMRKNMSAVDAVKLVRSKREIFPNEGFLEQLCDLDIRLRQRR